MSIHQQDQSTLFFFFNNPLGTCLHRGFEASKELHSDLSQVQNQIRASTPSTESYPLTSPSRGPVGVEWLKKESQSSRRCSHKSSLRHLLLILFNSQTKLSKSTKRCPMVERCTYSSGGLISHVLWAIGVSRKSSSKTELLHLPNKKKTKE